MTDDNNKLIKADSSIGNVLAQGLVQNLPEIVNGLKEAYRLHKRDGMFSKVLEAKIVELNLNKSNLALFVNALNDLSKESNADAETKAMYRDMIKEIHNQFMKNTRDYSSLSEVLDKI